MLPSYALPTPFLRPMAHDRLQMHLSFFGISHRHLSIGHRCPYESRFKPRPGSIPFIQINNTVLDWQLVSELSYKSYFFFLFYFLHFYLLSKYFRFFLLHFSPTFSNILFFFFFLSPFDDIKLSVHALLNNILFNSFTIFLHRLFVCLFIYSFCFKGQFSHFLSFNFLIINRSFYYSLHI